MFNKYVSADHGRIQPTTTGRAECNIVGLNQEGMSISMELLSIYAYGWLQDTEDYYLCEKRHIYRILPSKLVTPLRILRLGAYIRDQLHSKMAARVRMRLATAG